MKPALLALVLLACGGPKPPTNGVTRQDAIVQLASNVRDAQVYVDGYYAGVVDDYDGAFQALKLESGAYRIEIRAPGYETLAFDVRITPGQKIRYQGDLRRVP